MSLCIGHVVPFASRIGGYEKQALLLAGKQAELGNIVYIITHAKDAIRLSKQLKDQIPSEVMANINIVGVPWFAKVFYGNRKIYGVLQNIDIIHAHALDRLSAKIVKAAKKLKKPAIVKIATGGDINRFAHPDKYPSEITASSIYSRKLRPVFQPLLLRNVWGIIRQSEMFIAINSAIEQELQDNGIDRPRIRTMPNAVRIPDQIIRAERNGLHSLYVGRLEQRKCVNDILDAFAIVKKTVPNATLTIVGDGSYKNELSQKYSNIATFTGYINDPIDYYEQADIFVFASEHEGCPNVVLEAAAHGMACIATDIDGIKDWLRDGKDIELVPTHEPEIMAKKWLSLIKNHNHRLNLGISARNHMDTTANINLLCNIYNNIYNNMLEKQKQKQ